MAKSNVPRINQTAVLLVICAASATLGFVLRPNKIALAKVQPMVLLRQSDEKVIEVYERPDELLEFSNLRVKNLKIASGRQFSPKSIAESNGSSVEDWLENLQFTFKNKSDKRIAFIRIELQFLDTLATGPLMVYNQLGIGIYPKASEDALKARQPLVLNPADTTTFTLSAKDLQLIKDFLGLRNFQLANLKKVVIKIGYVIFDDGIMWSLGNYYRPNPTVPGGYERID